MNGKLLDHYLGRKLLKAVLLAWFGLLVLFAFFTLIEQLDDLGSGDYGLFAALYYTVLSTPYIGYELLPIAAVLGSMLSLGALVNDGELVAMHSAGISRLRMMQALFKVAAFFIIFHFALGELLAFGAKRHGIDIRDQALTGRKISHEDVNFWAIDKAGYYIRIQRILSDQSVEGISRYWFDNDNVLQTISHAATGRYQQGRWHLRDVTQSHFADRHMAILQQDEASWESGFVPALIAIPDSDLDHLSLLQALRRMYHMKHNEQHDPLYLHILFIRLLEPLSVAVMLLLPLAVIRLTTRDVSTLQHIGIGSVFGVSWYILRDILAKLGIVYDIHPLYSVLLPLTALFGFILWRLARVV